MCVCQRFTNINIVLGNGSGNVGTGITDIEMSFYIGITFSYRIQTLVITQCTALQSNILFFEKFNFIIFKSLVCMS